MKIYILLVGLVISFANHLMAQDVSSKSAKESVFNTPKIDAKEKTDTINMIKTTSKREQAQPDMKDNLEEDNQNREIPIKLNREIVKEKDLPTHGTEIVNPN